MSSSYIIPSQNGFHEHQRLTEVSTAAAATTSKVPPPQQNFLDVRIEEIDSSCYGNPSIASGSFGDVTIALCCQRMSQQRLSLKNDDSGTSDAICCWGYAAVKTIRNAVLRTGAPADSPLGRSWCFVCGSDIVQDQTSCRDTMVVLTREAFSELAILRDLAGDHPCIVPLLAVYPSRNSASKGTGLSLVFPYCLTDLASVIELRGCSVGPIGEMIPDSVIKTVIRDVLLALAYCHENGIVHGDVNPANFLISSDGRIQLADFGLAVACSDEKLPSHALCTINYRAPEVLLGKTTPHYSLDIWAAGIILCELLTLHSTFMGRSDIDVLNNIFDVLGTPSEHLWPDAMSLPNYSKLHDFFDPREPKELVTIVPWAGMCHELRDVLQATIALDPSSRSSAAMCVDMPWFLSKPYQAPTQEVMGELVPEELIVPSVFFPDHKDGKIDLDGAKQRAVSIAMSRRAATQRAYSDEAGEWWLGPMLFKAE